MLKDLASWIYVIAIILLPVIIVLVMVYWADIGGSYPENERIIDSIPYQGM